MDDKKPTVTTQPQAENTTPAIKFEDTPEFKELLLKTLSELKEMLIAEEMIGAEFITDKKAAIATFVSLRKTKADQEKNMKEPPDLEPSSPVIQDKNLIATWTKKMEAMKELCAKAPKVRMMIPFDVGEKPGSFAELQINGYKLSVLKGFYVDLPQPFAEMVEESWKQTIEAGSDKLLDRVDPETGKPMSESQALA
jgi:hypothetical protein